MANTIPLYDPQRGWRMWYRSDVYTGPTGSGQWVPNPNDLVFDYATGFWRVQSVNPTTFISTMISWKQPDDASGVMTEDILLGSGPGSQSETYRVYLDTKVVPYTLGFDLRLFTYSSEAHHLKVFRGTDISNTGIVISAMVDQNGNVVSENIPLETRGLHPQTGVAIKVPVQGYSVEELPDGEVVTAVVYTAAGVARSTSKLLIKRSNTIRPSDASRKYVTSIQLISPRISSSNNNLLEYPVNMLIQSGGIQGRVNYSDGSHVILPIDGVKFELQGLERYVATQVGQQSHLLLVYHFGDNEYGYTLSGEYPDRFMHEEYEITTTEVEGSYSVKLFVAPVWQPGVNNYKLEYWLYNLERDETYYVTPYVNLVAPYASYNPLPTGNPQTLQARIELSSLGSSFSYYAHTQIFTLCLLTPGSSLSPNWWIQYSPSGPQYGGANAFEVTNAGGNNWTGDLTLGKATQAEWLEATYFNSEPLIHPTAETVAPTPTHFRLKIGNDFSREIAVANWNQTVSAMTLTPPDPAQGDVARLEFIQRVSGVDYEVGVGILPIHRIA